MPKDIPIHENLPYKIYKIHFIFTYDDELHRQLILFYHILFRYFIIEILMIVES